MKYGKEIGIGIGISVVLTGVVSWHPYQSTSKARIAAARMQAEVAVKYLESSKRKHGAYPASMDLPRDPWDIPYVVTEGRVCSNGPDQDANTKDDICAP